ncbi:protealysin inhibitor emfourin [uncultured Friedmanniella sp.]|uniref:protealysin inhibitor emfourin n=1 Tax=uncultured Friedmanniella sp. TaxID=335381 RepID=UPI0035C9CC5E
MTCTFVPPYLLARLASTGADPTLAGAGRSTLQVDARLRDQRAGAPRQPPAARTTAVSSDPAERVIRTADHTEQLPGTVARADGSPPTGDVAVDEAYDSSAQVWDLFATEFNRPSADGTGSTLTVTVHYGQDYDNAFWDGSQLVFGDGDGQVFDRFTKPMDVMAHEFAHGVTQYTAGLTYEGQSGALNESVSDVFASMTKQRALGQDAVSADWLIGEGIFLPGINAKALRSMTEPGTAYDDPRLGRDPQVGSMADYVTTTEDNGGVHLNSGIPNRAFALAAIAVGGLSWERTGKVWYDALTGGEVGADVDFAGFAAATVGSATRLFPDDSAVAGHVRAAWQQVGVIATDVAGTPAPTTPPVDVAPAEQARRLAVRRTGGFAGATRRGELDLDDDPRGPQLRQLLQRADLTTLSPGAASPDRFVYTVALDAWQLTLPEQDLTPELHEVVRIVLDDAGGVDLG